MNNLIQTFNFENNTIRIIKENGIIWFVAKDISIVLGYEDPFNMIKVNRCKSKLFNDSSSSIENQIKMIPKTDVYKLILRSKLYSISERFLDWLIDEILPIYENRGKIMPSQEKPMNKSIQIFNFENNTIRIIEIGGKIWFIAKDVAKALGYINTSNAITRHCRKAKSLINFCPLHYNHNDILTEYSLDGQTKLILESDVYRLTVKCKLNSSERFEDWIMEEIIPLIRKTEDFIINDKIENLKNRLLKLEEYCLKKHN